FRSPRHDSQRRCAPSPSRVPQELAPLPRACPRIEPYPRPREAPMTDRPGTTVMDSVLGDDAGTVSIRYSPTSAHLVLAGEVDARLNAQLASATLQLTEYGLPVDVDTRDVTFMDSAVIAL